jgi:hypothetical protein
VGIAWAVSEFLLKKRAMTFFVTHYPQLCQLSQVYPSVQNQHLNASVSSKEAGDIRYTYKLTSGQCPATTDYGVEMASSCGWPEDVVNDVSLTPTTCPLESPLHVSRQYIKFILSFVQGPPNQEQPWRIFRRQHLQHRYTQCYI